MKQPFSDRTDFRLPAAGGGRRIRRRGAMVLLAVLFLSIAVVALALVLNWCYLVLVHSNMQQRTDIFARAGVQEILDEDLLIEAAFPDQTNDVAKASAAVADLLTRNNDVGPNALELNFASDITLTPGYVTNVTQPMSSANFDLNPPFNALRVEATRDKAGVNPVYRLVSLFGSPATSTVASASYAALDSRVVGFAPTNLTPSPVIPLAIRRSAWFDDRVLAAVDTTNPNGRKELDVVLKATDGSQTANGAIVDFDGAGPLDFSALPGQIETGIFPSDMPLSGGQLGPLPVDLPSTDQSPANTGQLVTSLMTVSSQADRRRIFPLFEDYLGNPLTITGFIAADVLDAADIGSGGEQRLSVTIEPVFIVHFTALTDPTAAENVYIHKLRLTK